MYFFFFFPVGTDAKSTTPPRATVLLLLLLFAVFSVRYVFHPLYEELLGASFRPSNPTLTAALLSLFLHGGWLHLLGNALYLAIFGRLLEGRLGSAVFSFVFLSGGLAACWFQAWFTPGDSLYYHVPMIGASGGVAAVLGTTLVRFHFQRARILYLLFALVGGVTKGGVVYVNVVLACLFWFVFQIVHGLVAWGEGGAPVAYAGHAGGFLAGSVVSVALGHLRAARQDVHQARGQRYLEKGDWYAAAGEFTSYLREVPQDTAARAARARCFVLLGQSGDASAEYQDLLRQASREGDVPEVTRLYSQMRRYGIGTGLSEARLFRLAYDFQKAGNAAEAAEVFDELTKSFPRGPKAELSLIRRAELLWSELGAYEEAQATYERLLAEFPEGEWVELAGARLDSMRALTGRAGSQGRPATSTAQKALPSIRTPQEPSSAPRASSS